MRTDAQPYPHVSDGTDIEDFKESLRGLIREARQVRSPRRRTEAGQALAHVIETIPEVATARCVSVYASRPGEPDTSTLLDRLASRGVRVLLPVPGAGLHPAARPSPARRRSAPRHSPRPTSSSLLRSRSTRTGRGSGRATGCTTARSRTCGPGCASSGSCSPKSCTTPRYDRSPVSRTTVPSTPSRRLRNGTCCSAARRRPERQPVARLALDRGRGERPGEGAPVRPGVELVGVVHA